MKRTLVLPSIAVLAGVVWAQATPYATYRNARFAYAVDYPRDVLVPQGEAENGDGQKFLSKDKQVAMAVWGGHNALGHSIAAEFDFQAKGLAEELPGFAIAYKTVRGTWFVLSGQTAERIVYQKTVLAGDVFKSVRIEYPRSRKSGMDTLVTRISASFRNLSR